MRISTKQTLRAVCFLAVLWGAIAPARADQTNPRLGLLFDQLRLAADVAQEAVIEQQIWTIWLQAPDPAIQAIMDEGVAAMDANDLNAALEAFNRVVEQAPDFAEGWNKRATVNYLLGNHEQSLADIAETLALEPRHFGALSGRGLVYVELRDLERALDAFEDALAVNPQMTGARANADAILKALGAVDL